MESKDNDNRLINAKCVAIVYQKGDFTIGKFSNNDMNFSLKGNYRAKVGNPYKILCEEDKGSKYKDTYNVKSITYDLDLRSATKREITIFLSTLTSEKNAKNIVRDLDDPIGVIESKDIDKLTSIGGIGVATASRIFSLYEMQKDRSADIVRMAKYDLSDSLTNKIIKHYNGAEAAIEIIETNVYRLVEVDGIGFKKADMIYLKTLKGDPKSKIRVEAYIDYLFAKMVEEGNTWTTPRELVLSFNTEMPHCDLNIAIDYVNNSKHIVSYTHNDIKRLSLLSSLKVEESIISELQRLTESISHIKNDNLDSIIKKTEDLQGYKYDETQLSAIYSMENNAITIIEGLAGTGKSTIAKGYVRSLLSNNYTVKQCALSGKAASNLSSITGLDGFTIHNLLSYSAEDGKFTFNENNPLETDVVILDEVSMVDMNLFNSLLKAMPNGSKLIMMGDGGQLDSIGVGVMRPLIQNNYINVVSLDTIHRQAEKSAIITHSRDIRMGRKPKSLIIKTGTRNYYGENADLDYVFLRDPDDDYTIDDLSSHMLIAIGRIYKKDIEKFGVENVQVLTQTKTAGAGAAYEVNKLCQSIANPLVSGEDSISIGVGDYRHDVRVGDRIINNKNDKNAINNNTGKKEPIYNGNLGTILSIDSINEEMIVGMDSGEEIIFNKPMLMNVNLGYAITIHKSQGSTIPSTITALPFNYMMNSRELAYTAPTRSSEMAHIVTTPRAIKRCIEHSMSKDKRSGLDYQFAKINNRNGE